MRVGLSRPPLELDEVELSVGVDVSECVSEVRGAEAAAGAGPSFGAHLVKRTAVSSTTKVASEKILRSREADDAAEALVEWLDTTAPLPAGTLPSSSSARMVDWTVEMPWPPLGSGRSSIVMVSLGFGVGALAFGGGLGGLGGRGRGLAHVISFRGWLG